MNIKEPELIEEKVMYMSRFFRRALYNEEGITFVISLMVIVLLAILSVALASMAISSLNGAKFHYDKTAALYVAEAGAIVAIQELNRRGLYGILKGADGIGGTDDDGILSFGKEVDFSNGSYSVKVVDNDDGDGDIFTDSDGQVVISSTGKVRRTSNSIKVAFKLMTTSYELNAAILTGDSLTIKGNPSILGGYGSIHANGSLGDIDITGNVEISCDVTARYQISLAGNIHVGGDVKAESVSTSNSVVIDGFIEEIDGGVSKEMPKIAPELYIRATYHGEEHKDKNYFWLKADGSICDKYGNPIGQELYWSWSGNSWHISGDEQVDGVYYIEGDAEISGNHGSLQTPWNVTIIATGNIEVSGELYLEPNTKDSPYNVLFMAGRDIKITGSPSQNYIGFILAHEQIRMSGDSKLYCGIIAEDAENQSGMVTSNRFNGEVTYNRDLGPVPSVVTAIGW